MTEPARFVGHSPRGVLLDAKFWTGNPRLILAFLISCVSGAVLFTVVSASRGITPTVPALIIYSLVFWGLAVGARGLARLEIEHGIAETVNCRAVEWLRKIGGGEAPRPDLEHLEPRLLPSNPTSNIGIVRMLQHILKEARDRRSSPGFLMMQPYREESYGDLFRLQGLQRSALQLGILGTFVGLVLALMRLSPGTGGGFEITEIGPLVGSLDVAFTTSIAGIAVSVILGFVMMALRGKQEAYFRSMEEATISVASLARNAINKDEYLAELNQVQVAIHQLGDRILEQSQQTEAQTGVLQAGVRRLVETKGELDGFLDRLGEEQSAFVGEMKEVYEHLSPERLVERLDERIESTMEEMLDRWGQGIDSSLGNVPEIGGALRGVIQALERVEGKFLEERERFQETADRSSVTVRKLSMSLDKVAQRQIEWLEELQRAVPENLDEVLKDAVFRAFTAVGEVNASAPPAASESVSTSTGAADLVATFKAVGEVQHTTLRRIAEELSELRKSTERRRRPGAWLNGFRHRMKGWLRREWEQTVADFRSFGRGPLSRKRRTGRMKISEVSGEEA